MSMVPMILLLLGQAAEPARVVLTGTVVGLDGKPATGAEVVLAEGTAPVMNIVRLTGAVLRPPDVLVSRRSEAEGRFRVELPGDDLRIKRFRRPVFLWAFGPGGTLAMRPFPDDWPPDGVPVRLALAPSEAVRFRVLDPEERPVAGARVIPVRIRGVDVPVELGGRFAAGTDAEGRGTLAVGVADELEVIRVTSGPFGVQQLRMTRPDAEGVRTLQLRPVGRIVGQIQAGDPQAVRGLAVRIRTLADPSTALTGVGGFASVVSDDQGRFTVPAIASGMLSLSIDLRWDLPWRSLLPNRPPVQPGTTTELTIPLKPAALVKGVVQEIGSGRPVAGVGVAVVMDIETPLAPSDAEGRFSAYIAPGMARAYAVGMPRGYYSPSNRVNSQPLPERVKELTMKPLGLRRAVEVRRAGRQRGGKSGSRGGRLRPLRHRSIRRGPHSCGHRPRGTIPARGPSTRHDAANLGQPRRSNDRRARVDRLQQGIGHDQDRSGKCRRAVWPRERPGGPAAGRGGRARSGAQTREPGHSPRTAHDRLRR